MSGRKITLDGYWSHDLSVEARRVESALGAGFRVGWLTGSDDEIDLSFELDCGAGVGSPWLIMSVNMPDGTVLQEVADVRPLVRQWLEKIVADGPTPTEWWRAQFPPGAEVEIAVDPDGEEWETGTVTLSDDTGVWVHVDEEHLRGAGEDWLNRGRVRKPVNA